MERTIFDILKWIKNPDETPFDIDLIQKFKLLFQILVLDILVASILVLLVYFIDQYVIALGQELLDINPLALLFLAVVIMPAFEEFIFRFPLKWKRNYLFRLINKISGGAIRKRWKRGFKYFVYIMATGFALIHLWNYSNREFLFYLLSPIIVGSQLFGGLTLSYIRIKLGFIWCVLQHGLFNLITITIGLLFFHNYFILNIEEHKYSFQVAELMYVNSESTSYSSIIEDEKVYSIHARDINLQGVIDSLFFFEEKLLIDKWVNVDFKSKEGIDKEQILKLLQNEFSFKLDKE